MGILDVADRLWPLIGRVADLHVRAYRATGGRIGHGVPGMPAMLLLDHVGARSGRERTTPLLYITDGDDLAVVASKGGHPRHPAWLHNLRAHPDTTVQVKAEVRPVRAREATPEERPRLWQAALRTYPTYETYRRRTDREIPIVILERRVAPAPPPAEGTSRSSRC